MLVFTGDINLIDWYFNAGFGIGTRIANGFDPFRKLNRNANDLWVGNFEGVASNIEIADNISIGANATVNKSFNEQNTVVAGTPAKVVKTDVPSWNGVK